MELALTGFGILLFLAFIGVPLAFATLAVGFFGLMYLRGMNAALSVSSQWIVETSLNYSLSIIPLFVLMGAFIHRSGISRDLFAASYAWLGRFRGGLALSGVLSCAGFAAVCGSSLATAATMTRVAVPPMREFKYNEGFAAGTIAAGGTLGIMIPPSVPLAIYGIVAGEDIGLLFIAGILPGILLIVLFMAAVVIVTGLRPDFGPKGVAMSLRDTLRASYSTWPVILLFSVVLGGIYVGIFTPTEAAAVGCAGAFVFGVFRGHFLDRESLWGVFQETVTTTAMIFAIVFSALILAQFVNLTGMPYDLQALVLGWGLGPTGLVLMICAICVLLGMVFESIGILLLIIPVFLPSLSSLGVDLIWFGILVIIVIELGLISPPIGMNVFVVKSVAPEIPLLSIFLGVLPYLIAMVLGGILILNIPAIATFLPNAMR
ncbi:TRAP transporter large permease [Marinovum sp. 2_MG-2023]|uniref:TRAP transporter large permease n=1 Tax=unclassified Marinovum TaxID=2647166 RepID=UPI0026E3C346|nr:MULTISPECIES: TRAP transporter large permease [unclassified Marinovum]MDO6729160.1 TRAP transporter large permease [Marinovum sp. 2_MG-2023]MDO6779213.1 TRAP transporter large permease [Marinovum sp. 1_MG-2023]